MIGADTSAEEREATLRAGPEESSRVQPRRAAHSGDNEDGHTEANRRRRLPREPQGAAVGAAEENAMPAPRPYARHLRIVVALLAMVVVVVGFLEKGRGRCLRRHTRPFAAATAAKAAHSRRIWVSLACATLHRGDAAVRLALRPRVPATMGRRKRREGREGEDAVVGVC